ncbi:MAG: lysophospholipid acyltransferase family protein [Acidimicrobiia bacterium]
MTTTPALDLGVELASSPEFQWPIGVTSHPTSRKGPKNPWIEDPIERSSAQSLVPLPRAGAPLAPFFEDAEYTELARNIPPDSELRRGDVDEWGRSQHIRDLAMKVYEPIYSKWFRAEWEGLEHIPESGGALLVANHAGAIPSDAPVIMHGIEKELGRRVYGLAEYLFRALPLLGTLWARAGGVPAHPDNAYRLLHDRKQLALVFPEGSKGTGKLYRERYQLRRFGRGGFVEIAMRAGVPIIPIAVVGAEEAMPIVMKSSRLAKLTGLPYLPITANMLALGPLGAVVPFPAKLRLKVLPPVSFDVPPDQERYGQSRVMDEAEAIRQQIQEALYGMLRERRNVWFG